jgi:hypothetical protein
MSINNDAFSALIPSGVERDLKALVPDLFCLMETTSNTGSFIALSVADDAIVLDAFIWPYVTGPARVMDAVSRSRSFLSKVSFKVGLVTIAIPGPDG